MNSLEGGVFMEFSGNRICIRELAAVVVVAFFAGRVHLFSGVFPAAPALILVMVAVSTVYIYLLPFVLGAMALYINQGIFG